jgi:positive regulator of sigma E activity
VIETTVRVVRIDAGQVWFVSATAAQCAGCAAASLCATDSSASRRMGRLVLDDLPEPTTLRVGDRIVVGIDNQGLLRALLLTYMLPLLLALAAGVVADGLLADQRATVATTVVGLIAGLAIALRQGRRPAARDALASHYLRAAAT